MRPNKVRRLEAVWATASAKNRKMGLCNRLTASNRLALLSV